MKVKLEYIVELPDIEYGSISELYEHLEEFLRFETGDNGQMKSNNPFARESIEPIFGTFEWQIEEF